MKKNVFLIVNFISELFLFIYFYFRKQQLFLIQSKVKKIDNFETSPSTERRLFSAERHCGFKVSFVIRLFIYSSDMSIALHPKHDDRYCSAIPIVIICQKNLVLKSLRVTSCEDNQKRNDNYVTIFIENLIILPFTIR